jgi:hypothetical protein
MKARPREHLRECVEKSMRACIAAGVYPSYDAMRARGLVGDVNQICQIRREAICSARVVIPPTAKMASRGPQKKATKHVRRGPGTSGPTPRPEAESIQARKRKRKRKEGIPGCIADYWEAWEAIHA